MRHRIPILALATLVAAATACSDSTGGGGGSRPPGQLQVIRLAPTAPTLCADSVGSWVRRDPAGQDTELALVFPESGVGCGGSTEDFLRLKIAKDAIRNRPDGSTIPVGDSIFVSVVWVGNDSILFRLEPSGLTFDPANPADLKIEYGEAGDDLNEDGQVNSADTTVENHLDIWRQEQPGDDFVRVGTGKFEDANEIEAKLNGFSRYAIAY